MAENNEFENVVGAEEISGIADAIRKATRNNTPMTILEMPEKLKSIKVLMTGEVGLDLSTAKTVNDKQVIVVGKYDPAIKHLFIVLPKEAADSAKLSAISPYRTMQYNSSTGELSMVFDNTSEETLTVIVLDMLLPDEEATLGLVFTVGATADWSETDSTSPSYIANKPPIDILPNNTDLNDIKGTYGDIHQYILNKDYTYANLPAFFGTSGFSAWLEVEQNATGITFQSITLSNRIFTREFLGDNWNDWTVIRLSDFVSVDAIGDYAIEKYSSMPVPPSGLDGKIVMYTGTTTASFVSGHFYKAVNNAWQELEVQSSVVKVVNSGGYITLSDSQHTSVPSLTAEQVTDIYNSLVAGKVVYIRDYAGDNDTLITEKALFNEQITIYCTYLSRLTLTYTVSGNNVVVSFVELQPKYELIETITLDEDVTSIARTTTPQGEAYNFRKLLIMVGITSSVSSSYIKFAATMDNSSDVLQVSPGNVSTTKKYAWCEFEGGDGTVKVTCSAFGNSPNSTVAMNSTCQHYIGNMIKGLTISTYRSSELIKAGSTIRIYGMR